MNASMIIEALGGTFRVAELCEVRPPSVSDWKKHGIPRARMMFLRVARPEVFEALDEDAEKRSAKPLSTTKKSAA
ncbi:hypothetical protein CFBP6411_04663 [Pseudomonas syringae group genomosp. 3]|uniref:Rha family transcriptional regulator n=1 Tax=Pseudomonas syringae group genomosp. 3 TaxID=251701 RepID=A0A2K4WJF7_9PSED|nr:hypothetical protein CFBP6411_04663 [Pseudomonas syringae group genomosp. 3]